MKTSDIYYNSTLVFLTQGSIIFFNCYNTCPLGQKCKPFCVVEKFGRSVAYSNVAIILQLMGKGFNRQSYYAGQEAPQYCVVLYNDDLLLWYFRSGYIALRGQYTWREMCSIAPVIMGMKYRLPEETRVVGSPSWESYRYQM